MVLNNPDCCPRMGCGLDRTMLSWVRLGWVREVLVFLLAMKVGLAMVA